MSTAWLDWLETQCAAVAALEKEGGVHFQFEKRPLGSRKMREINEGVNNEFVIRAAELSEIGLGEFRDVESQHLPDMLLQPFLSAKPLTGNSKPPHA